MIQDLLQNNPDRQEANMGSWNQTMVMVEGVDENITVHYTTLSIFMYDWNFP